MGSDLYEECAHSLSADKILNLAAIFAVFDLPDCAGELAIKYRSLLAPLCDVDRLLAVQAARTKTSYPQYMEPFEKQPQAFLSTKNPIVNLSEP